MKILHITASYKPAFIYGGPIYSVAALCEALEATQAEGLRLKAESLKREVEGASSVEEAEGGKRKAEGTSSMEEVESGKEAESKNHLLSHRSADYDQNTTTVEVYTTLANGKEELPYRSGQTKIIDGVAVTYFKRITKDHSHFSPALLLHLWKNVRKFDVVHIHSWWNLVSMGAVCICLLKGVKPVVSPRGMLGDYTLSKTKRIFHQFIGKHLLKRCNFHATTTMEAKEIAKRVFNGKAEVIDLTGERGQKWEEQRESLNDAPSPSERVGVRRIFIIHNLVKLPAQLPVKTRLFDGTLNLIFLSRIHHKKGIELLLDALALVDFPFKLSIVGEGDPSYVESLKRKAEGIKLDGYINWIGAVYGNKKYQLLADHDVFILPSYNENFANVVIEAIAVGTPVLLSEHVGLQDYVKANNFGLVFKLDELKASLEYAYQLFLDEKLVINGSNTINNDFLVSKYLEMYSSVKN